VRFYLDDLRNAPAGWELARTFDEGLRLLRAHRGQWEAMSLDHDLDDGRGAKAGCGFDIPLKSMSDPRVEVKSL